MNFDRSKPCALRVNAGEWNGQCSRCDNGQYGCDRALAYEKTPKRTMRWVRLCQFVEREMNMVTNASEQKELLSYLGDELPKAQREGYDDTVQFLQHLIDTITAMRFVS